MASGDIGAVLDSFVDYDTRGSYPNVIHISGDVYAVACYGYLQKGWVYTFSVDSEGAITEPLIDSLDFVAAGTPGTGYIMPCIIHISGDYYAIAYSGSGNDGWLCTVTITSAGVIGDTVVDTLEFDTSYGRYPRIIHISGTIYAIAYTSYNETSGLNSGELVTVEISAAGVIADAVTDSWEFQTDRGYKPDIIHIAGTTYAIAYSGGANSYDGTLISITIANDGTITKTVIDSLVFSADCWHSRILHRAGDVYAIAFVGTTDLSVVTATITSAGVISDAVLDTLIVDAAANESYSLSFAYVLGDIYVVAYTGTDADGFIASISITAGGAIGDAVLDTLEFYEADMSEPSIVVVSSSVLIIAHEAAGDGDISTISISAAQSFPTEAISRVTNLIHRYNRNTGVYTLEMSLGEVTSDFGLPEWLTMPQPAVPEEPVAKAPEELPPIPPGLLVPGPTVEELIRRAKVVEAEIARTRKSLEATGLTEYAREVLKRHLKELETKLIRGLID